ncbi:zf-BED domain-containing protein, partial [Cephalotus follicularis]
KKLTSEVWNHFERKNIDGKRKSIFHYCKKELGADSRNVTSHLREHIKRCPKRVTKDLHQMVLTTNKNKAEGKMSIGNYAYDPDVARRELANMIILSIHYL